MHVAGSFTSAASGTVCPAPWGGCAGFCRARGRLLRRPHLAGCAVVWRARLCMLIWEWPTPAGELAVKSQPEQLQPFAVQVVERLVLVLNNGSMMPNSFMENR